MDQASVVQMLYALQDLQQQRLHDRQWKTATELPINDTGAAVLQSTRIASTGRYRDLAQEAGTCYTASTTMYIPEDDSQVVFSVFHREEDVGIRSVGDHTQQSNDVGMGRYHAPQDVDLTQSGQGKAFLLRSPLMCRHLLQHHDLTSGSILS